MVRSVAVQSNGKILIAGNFTNIDGLPRISIARLNETNQTSVIFFGSTNWTVSETGTNAQIEVVRHGNTTNPAAVDYLTADETAESGNQFVGGSGTLSFAPGEGAKVITIPLIADHLPGPVSTEFKVLLTNVTGDALLNNAYAAAAVSITEADQTVELDSTNYSVNEFGPNVGLTVRRSGPRVFAGNLLVDYTTSDLTAKAGQDYQAVSGTLTFVGYAVDRPGPSELQVAIPVFNNALFYGEKFLSFSLSNARFSNSTGGTVLLGTNKSAVITINGGG